MKKQKQKKQQKNKKTKQKQKQKQKNKQTNKKKQKKNTYHILETYKVTSLLIRNISIHMFHVWSAIFNQ